MSVKSAVQSDTMMLVMVMPCSHHPERVLPHSPEHIAREAYLT